MVHGRVGRLYDPEVTRWPERIAYEVHGRAHELALFVRSPTALQVRGLEVGRVELALVVEQPVLLWLMRMVPGLSWSEAEYNWHLQPTVGRRLPPPLAGAERPLLHVLLVRANGGEVAARRTIPLSASFSAELHQAVRQQANARWRPSSFERRLGALRSRYPMSEQMLALTRVRCTSDG